MQRHLTEIRTLAAELRETQRAEPCADSPSQRRSWGQLTVALPTGNGLRNAVEGPPFRGGEDVGYEASTNDLALEVAPCIMAPRDGW